MIIAKRSGFVSSYVGNSKHNGIRVSLVPTMGALHEGHLTLIRTAREMADLVVCTIFVNPTQFNDPADYKKYPRTLEKDIDLLEANGADLLFLPEPGDIYQDGITNLETYDLGELESKLEGKYRPGHFQGVCQVMRRILDIIKPDNLLMGQKDFQQCMVIRKLIQIIGDPINFVAIPTVREKDGLAMSSRNLRLNPAARKNASAISKSLQFIKNNLKPGDLSQLIKKATQILEEDEFRIDYVEIADAGNLEIVKSWNGKQKLVALIAAFQGDVRLIDNMLLNEN